MVFASVEVRLAFPALVTDRDPDVTYDLRRWLKAPRPKAEEPDWLASAFETARDPGRTGRYRRRS